MKENQFMVDLGKLKLDEAQRSNINAAIQKAVAGQLAALKFTNHVALFPVNKFPHGPIINGIVAREFPVADYEKFFTH